MTKLRDENLAMEIRAARDESKLRDENLAHEWKVRDELTQAKLETQNAKLEALSAKMDYQYASIMNALNLDRRLEVLEREKQAASA